MFRINMDDISETYDYHTTRVIDCGEYIVTCYINHFPGIAYGREFLTVEERPSIWATVNGVESFFTCWGFDGSAPEKTLDCFPFILAHENALNDHMEEMSV